MQKTVITVVCIIAVLISLLVIENNVVGKYCNNFYNDVRDFKKDLEKSADVGEDIEKIIDKWEKNKDKIYVFVNHNSFRDIETALYNCEYYIKNNDRKEALFQSEFLLHRVIELRGSFKFSLGNLL